MEIRKILSELPFYDKLSKDDIEMLENTTKIQTYEKNSILHDHHSECLGFVKLLSGHLRVTMQSEDGREITIYTMEPGDVDVLSASCVINQLTFDSMMIADKDSEVMVIPAMCLSVLQNENIYVKSYLYEISAQRFSDAMWTMQQILFMKADQRVASGLLDEYARTDDTRLRLTQEELAKNINSAREVVARMLKKMEREKLIKLGRGTIELLDPDGIEEILG